MYGGGGGVYGAFSFSTEILHVTYGGGGVNGMFSSSTDVVGDVYAGGEGVKTTCCSCLAAVGKAFDDNGINRTSGALPIGAPEVGQYCKF